jgi:hypothetical protein
MRHGLGMTEALFFEKPRIILKLGPSSFLGLGHFGPTRHTRDEATRRSRDCDPPSDMAYWKGHWKDEREGERAEVLRATFRR